MPNAAPSDALPDTAADGTLDHNAVRAIRETRGYSVEKLSLTCGLAAYEITDIENGTDADPVKLRRIVSALRP